MRMISMMVALALCLATVSAQAGRVKETVKDTVGTERRPVGWRPQQLIVPGALMAVGALGIGNGPLSGLKKNVKEGVDGWRGDRHIRVDDYIQYLPVVAHLGLGAVGAKARHTFVERTLVAATAYATMGVLVQATKWAVNERRPDSRATNSFPSGHTATVFMGAELVRTEYSAPYGIAAYTVAAATAFLRVYNGRHWLTDVVAGAGFGILSARVGYWMLPLYQRWFRLGERKGSYVATMPTYDPQSRAVGFALSMQF